MVKVAVFSAKSYDREFLDEANFAANNNHELNYFEAKLDLQSSVLAAGHVAILGSNPGSRLLDYFAGHNINAIISQVQGRGHPIAETLQDHARDLGAELLVMGGFGHSRMRDFVLGGATRGILGDLRLPVLMSH